MDASAMLLLYLALVTAQLSTISHSVLAQRTTSTLGEDVPTPLGGQLRFLQAMPPKTADAN